MSLSRRIGQLGVAVLLVSAGAAAGITSASGDSSRKAQRPTASRGVSTERAARPQRATVPRPLVTAYAIFRHPATAARALPGSAAFTGPARYAGSAGGAPVWLVAGASQSCIVLASGGGACAPNAVVAHDGVVVGLVPASGGGPTVIGIVPDGARVVATNTAGVGRPVGLSGNTFVVRSANHIVSFTVVAGDGSREVTQMPRPAPPHIPAASRSKAAVRHGTAPAGGAAAKSGATGPGAPG